MKRNQLMFLGLAALILLITACGGKAMPAPGASFSGAIDMGDKASNGTLSFAISADGASITGVNFTLQELQCGGLTIGRIHDNLGGMLISMSDGGFSAPLPAMGSSQFTESQDYNLTSSPFDFPSFADMGSVGQFEGKFSSAKHASGTINIYIWAIMTDRACELGKFTWEAESP